MMVVLTAQEMPMETNFAVPRRLTHEEARQEQRDYASKLTIPERLAAMTALNERMRGIKTDEDPTNWNPRFVTRPKLPKRGDPLVAGDGKPTVEDGC